MTPAALALILVALVAWLFAMRPGVRSWAATWGPRVAKPLALVIGALLVLIGSVEFYHTPGPGLAVLAAAFASWLVADPTLRARIAAIWERTHGLPFALTGLAALTLGAMFLFEAPGRVVLAAIAGLIVAFAVAWFRTFLDLMARPDDDFPGRFDKPIWALLMIALPPIGLLAFRQYRESRWGAKPFVARARHDLA